MLCESEIAAGGLTIRNVRRDFSEWHLGRPRYALWALDVDVAPVRQRVQAAQDHMADWLLDGYQRQPHITLTLCGFPSDAPRHADDFGAEALRAQLDALRQARPRSFEIDIGALASFTSAPYLSVHDEGGHIAALRGCLTGGEGQEPGFVYMPHVTVGLYADAWPLSAVQARLDSFACDGPLRLRVAGISLMAYATGEIGGPLTRMADYDFGRGTLHWDEGLVQTGC
ncbi:MAG: 2'-5' RNA ligase family protein [Pseudomonadota bacterium]|nr:2'-5' RNA ligase family protein [Pseudomonadota bacterium]